eukprot:UN24290
MNNGGCQCGKDESCDVGPLIPQGCDHCGQQAAEACGLNMCEELEAKYPECDESYEGDMICAPSEEDMSYYMEHCEDGDVDLVCPDGSLAECCDVDGSCSDGDDDYCCNGQFYCSNDGAEYAQSMGGILCPSANGEGTNVEVDGVICPGQAAENFCDGDGDCVDHPEWCSC